MKNHRSIALGLALPAALFLAGCADPAQTAATGKPTGVPVRTASVETRDLEETLAAFEASLREALEGRSA